MRKMQCFIYVLCVLSTFSVQNICLSSEFKEIVLQRDPSYDGWTDTQYYLTTKAEITHLSCFVHCLMYSPECVSILYDENLRSCRLLQVHLDVKLVNSYNNTTDASVYWANYQACQDGWYPFDGHCYYLNETEGTWDEASDYCEQNGSYLSEINSPLENSWIKDALLLPVDSVTDMCPNFHSCSVWIGARDFSSTGQFVLSRSGEEMVYPEWGENQPTSAGGYQDCVVLMRNGKANDRGCHDKYQFICEHVGNIK